MLNGIRGIYLIIAIFFISFPLTAWSQDSSSPPIIRSIRIKIRKVFDENNLSFPYETANYLKIPTKEDVIRRELLFKVGDKLDEFSLQESERKLRTLPYIRQAVIYSEQKEKGYSDVTVSVQDTWTLFPQFTFSKGAGAKKKAMGIKDTNLFGYGKRLELLYMEDDGRESIQTVYDDNRLFNSKLNLLLANFIQSDGYKSVISLGRPFRSLFERKAWVVNGESYNLISKLFKNGDERFIFRNKRLDVHIGISRATGNPKKLRHRYTLGYDYQKDDFSMPSLGDFKDVDVNPKDVSQDKNLLAKNRRFSGPFFSLREIHPNFITLDYIDRFDRLEDFNLGTEVFYKLGLAPKFLYSNENTLFLKGSVSRGRLLSSKSFIRGGISAGTRYGDLGFSNSTFRLEAKYYNSMGVKRFYKIFLGRHTLASSVKIDFSHELDKDKEFLLGASNGLRGYDNKTFTGDNRVILNLEDRFHLFEDIGKVFSLGGAFFFDIGGASNKNPFCIVSKELYSDMGVGLRVAFPRAAKGSVLRIDLAYPFRDGPDGTKKYNPKLLVTFGQVFSSSLTSEAPRVKQAAIDSGF